jgi:hypothetical protein
MVFVQLNKGNVFICLFASQVLKIFIILHRNRLVSKDLQSRVRGEGGRERGGREREGEGEREGCFT